MYTHSDLKMAIFSIRLDDQLKREMKKLRHVNWSEIIRQAIVKKINEEKSRNLAKAVLLNEKVRKEAPKNWDTTKILRYWREHRFGRSSS